MNERRRTRAAPRRMRVGPAAALFLAMAVATCDKPGLHGLGTGTATFDDSGRDDLDGICTYVVGTRWGSPLPHELRIEDNDSDSALVVRARRRFREGVQDVGGSRRFVTRATFMEGSTVRGGVGGTLAVETRGDTLVAVLSGVRAYRDTVAVRAECRVMTS